MIVDLSVGIETILCMVTGKNMGFPFRYNYSQIQVLILSGSE